MWTQASTGVDFQVLMVVASGLMVRFLRVLENNNYQNVKWMRYLTKAEGTYQEVSIWPYLFCGCSQAQFRDSRQRRVAGEKLSYIGFCIDTGVSCIRIL